MKTEVIYHPQGDRPPKATLLYGADVREALKSIPDESVQTICTSPPYWGLRDYGVPATVWGGDPECPHDFSLQESEHTRANPGGEGINRGRGFDSLREQQHGFCNKCGAWLGNFGLEPTPDMYVEHFVEICRELRRVLRSDGTFWLNLGDSYMSHPIKNLDNLQGIEGDRLRKNDAYKGNLGAFHSRPRPTAVGLKDKDLVGIPWMVAFALRADGWWLRRDIIWSKPNPMPESITDRPTTSHEYLFLLTKSRTYYYDAEAVREACTSGESDIRKMIEQKERIGGKHKTLDDPYSKASAATNIGHKRGVGDPSGRNLRSVWTIATVPFPGAHFATWPPKLVERMVKAGTAPGGVVLDPFSGSGTTGWVALNLGRDYIGIDLNEDYLELAKKRILGMNTRETENDDDGSILDLFGDDE